MPREVLYEALALRQAVFVVEQHTAYQEVDGDDRQALHVWGTRDGALVAYLRLLPPDGDEGVVTLQRVVVDRRARGLRLGEGLVREGLRVADATWPAHTVRIEALAHLRRFYTRLGFVACGATYDAHGWAHLPMKFDKIR